MNIRVWHYHDNKKPTNAVYVGRGSKWGNPFTHRQDVAEARNDVTLASSREEAIEKYEEYLLASSELMNALHELSGKDLVCWCAPKACHADVLMKYANIATTKKETTVKNIDDERCVAIKGDGTQCKNNKKHDNPLFCGPHETMSKRKELKTVISDIEVQNKMAESFSQQSEETKEVVREAVRKITNNEEPTMTRIEMNDLFLKEKQEDYEFVIGGTGARALKLESNNTKAWVAHYMRHVLSRLKERFGSKLAVLSGMAEGFDELLARLAMELQIDLIAAIPSEDYGNYYWGNNSVTGTNRIEEFNSIVEYAKNTGGVIYVCDDYRGFAPQRPGKANFDRNEFMVKLANGFYAWDIHSRGTSHCIKAITKAGKKYVDIKARLPEYIKEVTGA